MLGVALDQFNHFKPSQMDLSHSPYGSKVTVQTESTPRPADFADAFSRIQQVLNHRLSESLGMPRTVPVLATNSPFDAETVAGNVLAFVHNRMKQAEVDGASPNELKSLLEQAKPGIQQGIEDAKEALEGMSLLTEPIKAGIDQLDELIYKGLEPIKEMQLSTIGTQLIEASHRFRQTEKSAFELQVKTRDGDIVTLKFQQHNREQGSLFFNQQGQSSDLSMSYTMSAQTRFSLSVEGNLDEGELSAISDLAQKIQQVSEEFFDGNVQAAFEQGMRLGYNTDEITGFSLEMSHSQTSIATTKYREIRALDMSETPQLTGLDEVQNLLDQLSGIIEQASRLFEDYGRATSGMMHGFLSRHPQAEEFSYLLNRLGDEQLEKVTEKLVAKAKRHQNNDEIG